MKKLTPLATCLILICLSACAFKRTSVLKLGEKQKEYYVDLTETLEANRLTLKAGLEQQLSANRAARLNLLRWERDLQKGEILLQVDSDVTGNQRLLAEKLAQLNLESLVHFQDVQTTEDQGDAILKLYDAVITSIATVEKNNDIIIQYLASEDQAFALRSLDVAGIVSAISGIRSLQRSLGDVEERSERQQEAERQRVQSTIERARDAVLLALQAREGD